MRMNEAKGIAALWVDEHEADAPGFVGAFLHGSIAWLPDDAELAPGSDVDLMIVLAGDLPEVKLGKTMVDGLILDVTPIALSEVESAEIVLANYHLAGSLCRPTILRDPSGRLTTVHKLVAAEFARREWVIRRCEDARGRVLRNLDSIAPAAPFHEQVTSWLFGTGVTTHILLTAGLRNPTVRRRYQAARELLIERGRAAFYDRLLALLGCETMPAARVSRHVDALAAAFDAAGATVRTPLFFATDLSPIARPIAIDGSREMIARGAHREAVFWIVATYARCMTVFAVDGTPEQLARFEPAFRALLGELSIVSTDDLQRRADEVRAFLPTIWDVAMALTAENPEIR